MPKIIGSSLAEHRQRVRTALFTSLAELMNERSFDRITLSDVAAHAGVGRTAVYNHFADKEDLLLAFMEHESSRYAAELAASLEGLEDPIDRLRVFVRQQALIKRNYHFPTFGPLANAVSHSTAGNLRAHAGRTTRMLAQILTDAMAAGAIPEQNVAQVIPLVNAAIMGGRPTPTDACARATYLDTLDTFILRAVGATVPDHAVPEVQAATALEPVDDGRSARSGRTGALEDDGVAHPSRRLALAG